MTLHTVGILGSVEAWSTEGDRLDLGPMRHRAVLAVLAMRANTAVEADTLIDVVWDGRAPATARKLVHTYVCRLRKVIQPASERWNRNGLLSNSSAGYRLALPDNALDTQRFETQISRAQAYTVDGRLVEARELYTRSLELWRGEPLAGLSSPLIEAERRRLEECRVLVTQERLMLDLELGHHAAAVPELLELASAHPYRERVLELLMTALYRSGRQSDALDAYARTRTLLGQSLGVEPGPPLQTLHLQILRADPALDFAPGRNVGSTRPFDLVVPAQLPRGLTVLTGREKVVDQLIAELSADHLPVRVIAGRPGVGKTALAIHVGHSLRPQFPDGQLFLNLGGVRPSPTAPAAALDTMIRAIMPHAAQLPDSIEERAALFRSLTADRRLLIVLDDARSADQVRPLIPGGSGCAVLMTSRLSLAGLDDARHVRLDSLDPADALRMLRQTIGDARVSGEAVAAAAIVDACGGLPLAIQIIASKLNAQPYSSLRQVAEMLSDETARLSHLASADRAMAGSIALSVSQLDRVERDALTLLSLADQQWLDRGDVAALLDIDAASASAVVDTLVDWQMLDPLRRGPLDDVVVSFHDLVRLFMRTLAASSLTEVDRRQAIERLARRYLGLLNVADDHLPLTTDSVGPRLAPAPFDADLAGWIAQHPTAWLDTEGPRITAVIRQAALLGLTTISWRLLDKLLSYTLLRSRWDLWHEVGQIVLNGVRAVGDAQGEAVLLQAKGRIELDRSDGRLGEPNLRASLELFRSLNDQRGEARALIMLALQTSMAGQFDQSLAYSRTAAELAWAVGDRECYADAIGLRASATWRNGDHVTSLRLALKARALYQDLGKPRDLAVTNLAIAKAHELSGDLDAAMPLLRESLSIVEGIGDLRGQAFVLRDLGLLAVNDTAQERIAYLERSRAICVHLRADRALAQVLYGLGRIHDELGAETTAADHYQGAWNAIREHPGDRLYEEIERAAQGRTPVEALIGERPCGVDSLEAQRSSDPS